MKECLSNKSFEIIDDGNVGKGLRTRVPFIKRDFVMEFVGERISLEEKIIRDKNRETTKQTMDAIRAWISDDKVILGVPDFFIDPSRRGNYARFVNHCCEPNTMFVVAALHGQWRVFLQALEEIQAGDTLTVDYGDLYAFEEVKCLCKSVNCKGFIGGLLESPRRESLVAEVIPVKRNSVASFVATDKHPRLRSSVL